MVDRVLTQDRFNTFHKEHSDIYEEFRRLAYDLYLAREQSQDTKERFGSPFLFSIMRYHHLMVNKPWVKIPGTYKTRYAGMLVAEDKRFSAFFVWWVIPGGVDEKS